MDITYTLGLLLFFLLIRNSLPEETDDYQYNDEDYGDEYYDFNSSAESEVTITTTKSPSPSSTTRNTISTTPEVIQMSGVFLELPKIEEKCPALCKCNDDFTFVDCSNRNIERMPLELPKTVERLDLRNNRISLLDQQDFINCSSLIELLLDNNEFTSINFKDFSQLTRLERISIANNQLRKIDLNAFSNLIALKKLNVSHNLIVIGQDDTSGSFLNQPKLRELDLSGCRLDKLYENTFQNLSELISLDLSDNDFGEKINTRAFEPLKKLEKLKLPELERNTVIELCKILTSIDLINFKNFDISCFELVAGSSFEESTITAKPPAAADDRENGAVKPATQDTTKPAEPKDEKSIVKANIKPNRTQATTMTTIHAATNDSLAVNTSAVLNEQKAGEVDDGHQVAISSQTINQILLGIIIVAVVGIIIGIICRRDICGIKTKMCRTRRPPPTDQVRPAEEIPLNKV